MNTPPQQGAHDETPTNLSQKTWHLPCPHRYMKLQLYVHVFFNMCILLHDITSIFISYAQQIQCTISKVVNRGTSSNVCVGVAAGIAGGIWYPGCQRGDMDHAPLSCSIAHCHYQAPCRVREKGEGNGFLYLFLLFVSAFVHMHLLGAHRAHA